MLGRENQVVDILTIISLSLSTSQACCRAPRPFRHSMLWTIVGQPSRLLHQTRPWARQNKLTSHVLSQLFFVPHPFVYLTLTVKTVEDDQNLFQPTVCLVFWHVLRLSRH